MKKRCFIPDPTDQAILDRGWTGLAAIVLQLAACVAACASAQAGPGPARRLARIAESLARRLLVADALRRGLPQARHAARSMTRAVLDRLRLVRRQPPVNADQAGEGGQRRRALFRLAEPLATFSSVNLAPTRYHAVGPSIRSFDAAPILVRRHSTDPRRTHTTWAGAVVAPEKPPAAVPADRLAMRLDRLRDVMSRRAVHVRRMGRWIAHQHHMRTQGMPGRSRPMRPGRAPGLCKRPRDSDHDQWLLADVSHVAGRAVSHMSPPPRTFQPPDTS